MTEVDGVRRMAAWTHLRKGAAEVPRDRERQLAPSADTTLGSIRPSMTKTEILAEIRRTAKANGGVPLGTSRFRTETGIKRADWYGRYWSSWGEAVQEAGLQAQDWIAAVPEERLLEHYVALVRSLGRDPRDPEVRRADPRLVDRILRRVPDVPAVPGDELPAMPRQPVKPRQPKRRVR